MLFLHHRDSHHGADVERGHAGSLPQLARRVSEGTAEPARRPHRAPFQRRAEGHQGHRRVKTAAGILPAHYEIQTAGLDSRAPSSHTHIKNLWEGPSTPARIPLARSIS